MNVKKLLSVLLFLVIMGATVFVVLKNQDLTEVLHTVAGMNKIYLGLAIAMAIFFVGARDFCFSICFIRWEKKRASCSALSTLLWASFIPALHLLHPADSPCSYII